MKAVLIKDNLPDFNGYAALYQMTPAHDGHEFVVASAANVPFSGPETYLFPAAADGEIKSFSELDGSYRGGLDHAQALSNAGYTIA